MNERSCKSGGEVALPQKAKQRECSSSAKTTRTTFDSFWEGPSSDSLEDVEVAKIFGEVLRLSDLLVVEEHPLAVLVDVADVVPAARVGAHVADHCLQAVHAISIIHRLTAGKEEKRNEPQKQSH